jgi:hypothetical protein
MGIDVLLEPVPRGSQIVSAPPPLASPPKRQQRVAGQAAGSRVRC